MLSPKEIKKNCFIALTDESGTVVESYDYDAWSFIQYAYSATGSTLNESAFGNRYLFQGREYDWNTKLYYFRARWYNPETGRWLSKDPIGIAGGLNLYEAFGSNPVCCRDPFGEDLVWGGAHSDQTKHHQKVQVENSDMSYGISFGPKNGTSLWGKIHVGTVSDGIIYNNTDAKWLPGKELGRMKLTKEEDAFVKGIMENMINKSAPYGVMHGIDCRLFSESTFNALVDIINIRREGCAK